MSSVLSRVFMNGNSQAVRIPHEFRLDVSRVEIHRMPNGDLVIHPVPSMPGDRGSALLAALQGFDEDFVEQLESSRDQQPPQERDSL